MHKQTSVWQLNSVPHRPVHQLHKVECHEKVRCTSHLKILKKQGIGNSSQKQGHACLFTHRDRPVIYLFLYLFISILTQVFGHLSSNQNFLWYQMHIVLDNAVGLKNESIKFVCWILTPIFHRGKMILSCIPRGNTVILWTVRLSSLS